MLINDYTVKVFSASHITSEKHKHKQWGGWERTRSQKGGQSQQMTEMVKGVFHNIRVLYRSCSTVKDGVEEGFFFQSYGIFLPKKPLHVIEPCSPGSSWTFACQRVVVNESLTLHAVFVLPVKMFFSQPLNFIPYLYLFSVLYLIWFFSPPYWAEVNKRQCGAELPTGVYPQQLAKQFIRENCICLFWIVSTPPPPLFIFFFCRFCSDVPCFYVRWHYLIHWLISVE